MTTDKLTFDQLPEVTLQLRDEVRELKNLVLALTDNQQAEETPVWFNLTELCAYLPDKPSKATVYGWVCNRQIPYHKTAKRLSFLKSEIDTWLMSSGKKTAEEIRSTAIASHGYRKGGAL